MVRFLSHLLVFHIPTHGLYHLSAARHRFSSDARDKTTIPWRRNLKAMRKVCCWGESWVVTKMLGSTLWSTNLVSWKITIFSIGNGTSTQSGSIFQPAMLVDRSVCKSNPRNLTHRTHERTDPERTWVSKNARSQLTWSGVRWESVSFNFWWKQRMI